MQGNGATIDGVIQMNQVLEQGRSYGHGWVKVVLRRESLNMCSPSQHLTLVQCRPAMARFTECLGRIFLRVSRLTGCVAYHLAGVHLRARRLTTKLDSFAPIATCIISIRECLHRKLDSLSKITALQVTFGHRQFTKPTSFI